MSKNFSITYNGPFRDAGGYSKMNREIVKALLSLGVNVSVQVMNSVRKCKELDIKELFENKNKTNNNIKKKFYIDGRLPQIPPRSDYTSNIVFTMMETETLHEDFVKKCNLYNEIIVPCEWNVEVFKNSGIKRPIYKVPLGVDVDLYNPQVVPSDILKVETEGKFVFFSLFGWSKRKGCDILLRSFIRKFGNNPDVVLVVMSRMWGSEESGKNRMIMEEMNFYAKQEGYRSLPKNIIHIGKGFEEHEMPSLFKIADCFVLPTRGDAFCLPLIEAGACEIPLITTRYGGQLEYLDDETANFIEIEGFDDCKRLGLDKISSYYNKDIKVAKLSEESINSLGNSMTYIINNYDEAKNKSKKLIKKITSNYTWKHSAEEIIKILSGD